MSDHAFADPPAQFEIITDLFWRFATYNEPTPSFHQVKWNTDYGCVFAEQVRPGRKRKQRVNCYEQPIFAGHVVSGRGDRAKRGSPQDKLVTAKLHKVGEIGMPAWELLDFDLRVIELLSR